MVVTVQRRGDKEIQGRDTWSHWGTGLRGSTWAQLAARAELRQEVGQEDRRWSPKHLTPGEDCISLGVAQVRDGSSCHSVGGEPKGC